jgi:choline dehydrogenase-like flavoprotein
VSAAAGADDVFDVDLRVHGVDGPCVCDASAMSEPVGAHINACVIMMADKASDIIRGKPALPQAEAA